MGTGSAFFLYDNLPYEKKNYGYFQDFFDNWNSMTIVPSLAQDENGSTLYTKMSEKDLGEDWEPHKEFILDN